ncbi:MAG: hypothetical protein K2O29_06100 [Ruminococcus sp.]|nr:hypothetical protein [Ruminococcus sp.]MDE7138014.1 hypothetical protein [Ruminococcus sp.]
MDNSINTEKIMSEIRLEIKKKNISTDILSFEDIPYKKPDGVLFSENPDKAVDHLRSHSYVQPYHQIFGNPVTVFLKKSVRKIIKFHTEPIVSEQNNFNASTVTAVASLRNTQKQLIKRIEKLEKENTELKRKLYGETK